MYDAASAGTQQGSTLTNAATAVSNGLFTVALDFGNQFPGADRWLEVGVRTNGSGAFSTLVPRQPLTSTPYAVRAANFSGTVAAGQISGNISSNNIGAGSITGVMLANGAVGSNQLASGAVTTTALAQGAVTAAKMATVTNWFALTIVKPTPADFENFGNSVAALGSDRVLIGAYNDDTGLVNAGAAYLFGINGVLLTTFTNPTPAANDMFGYSVATLGSDRIIVGALQDDTGAPNTGAAYLFNTNGILITTYTNPTPAADDFFGHSLVAVGSDRVLVSAYRDDTGATNSGAAYLFGTNGALLTTFTNPTPAINDCFGYSVSAVGNDRVLIGAYQDDTGGINSGVAYLFRTNGTLITTFTNPPLTSGDLFGVALAAVGSDRVIIGTVNAGAAYLFSTNGLLLAIFTDPTPPGGNAFGYPVAAISTERILIGESANDTGVANSGVAYLFNTNGTLLTTFTNPTPGNSEFFGSALAAVGSHRAVIGADQDDTGGVAAGAAYLFSFETFTDGLTADAVRASSINTTSLEDGSVTLAKLDPSVGAWLRSGNNIFRLDGNVGIGTDSPTAKLHLVGTETRFKLESSGATAFTATEYLADARKWDTGVGGSGSGVLANKYYIYDSTAGAARMVIDTSGNVGINTTAPTAKLSVNGTANNTTGVWGIFSDRRLKENIAPMAEGSLDRLMQLRGVTYNYNKPELREGYAGSHRGWIAQDVEKVFPDWISETEDGMKMLTPVGFNAITVEALRELRAEKDVAIQGLNQKFEEREASLRTELKRRDAENAELKARLEKLEQLLTHKPNGATK